MKCQSCFLGKIRKITFSLSSAEFANRAVKVNFRSLLIYIVIFRFYALMLG